MLAVAGLVVPVVLLGTEVRQRERDQATVRPEGELARRITMIHDRLMRGEAPRFTEAFVLADVALDPNYPRRFSEYSGDLSGRYIGAMALLPPAGGLSSLHGLVQTAVGFQRADGRFGDPNLVFSSYDLSLEHMALLWGNGRLLVGLLEFHATQPDAKVLDAARRLGDFLIEIRDVCASEKVAKHLEAKGAAGFICFTQLIEGLVLLNRATADTKYLDAAQSIAPWLQPRGVQHSHGYLTTLRGIMMLYEATRDSAYLQSVEEAYHSLVTSPDYLITDGVAEYFGGKGDRDEGCSEADFLRLSLQLWRVTGQVKYLERAERCLLNHFYANQFHSGDFGHHLMCDCGFAPSASVGRAWWCCTMHGLRAFRDVLDCIVTEHDGQVVVNLFLDATWSREGLELRTKPCVLEGQPSLTVSVQEAPSKPVPIAIRQPSWSDRVALLVNSEVAEASSSQGYWVISRRWRKQDTIQAILSPKTLLRTRDGRILAPDQLRAEPVEAVLFYGPWVLGVDDAFDPLFLSEPWRENVVLLPRNPAPTTQDGPLPASFHAELMATRARFRLKYRHGGFPDVCEVTLRPISERTAHEAQSTVAIWLRYATAGA